MLTSIYNYPSVTGCILYQRTYLSILNMYLLPKSTDGFLWTGTELDYILSNRPNSVYQNSWRQVRYIQHLDRSTARLLSRSFSLLHLHVHAVSLRAWWRFVSSVRRWHPVVLLSFNSEFQQRCQDFGGMFCHRGRVVSSQRDVIECQQVRCCHTINRSAGSQAPR